MFDTSWFKVLTFFGVWAAIWLPIAFTVSRLIGWQPNQILTPKQKLIFLASLYVLTPLIMEWKIKVENLSLAELGLRLQPSILLSILIGLFVSLVSLTLIFTLESIFKSVSWYWQNGKNLLPLLFPILCLSLLISLIEELIFRGYTFNTLLIDYPYWFAAAISSIIFAFLHLIWERKETLPQIPGLWLMGIVLIGARLVDEGSLGLAIGLHAGWIWGLTCIDSAQLVTYTQKDNWFTGINQQPLAGIAGILCLILTAVTLWLLGNATHIADLRY
ncbi:CPBP family intramembrane glutamic endopeptidase [Pleurocapsa sp. PCC 7319]|uniref:CPBP family intramembrane glutamic endopeptidase n=1 Tax=Pleurocapsa sp. PCC 7319 TaxID=118161 RepID=UPI0003777C36|nr:CPBP family intramembrane glutamic endopeptidase [Pleurocapsa sp. PCC 7319]